METSIGGKPSLYGLFWSLSQVVSWYGTVNETRFVLGHVEWPTRGKKKSPGD